MGSPREGVLLRWMPRLAPFGFNSSTSRGPRVSRKPSAEKEGRGGEGRGGEGGEGGEERMILLEGIS